MSDGDPHGPTQDFEGDTNLSTDAASLPIPERIGRYRIEKVLGKGGFGLVYLGHDDQLDRAVAIKVPHKQLVARLENAEAYLAEARTVANLDHPNIVPVHDIGSTDEFPCFVVSKYVEGNDLATRIKQDRSGYSEAAELVATVAEALHYAHKQGLVHRDVKPANILIDKGGQPHLADFGLALREENLGKGPQFAGTPAYMSPEQARGEGHRVDGRSDIFSLGVVLYELLVGRKPFRGDTQAELLEQVTSYEPRPLRQYDDHIPKELERICHKTLAKRASERYSTATDFTEDLRLFLAEQTVSQGGTPSGDAASETHASAPNSTSVGFVADSSDSQPIRIVPKGLRSFDAHDANFFLELLPGPRDREGLPDSLRFWKTRTEEKDPDNTFAVGLIYGPSGCGKSSLVRAGLLPRLSEDVIPVYIEATPDETEARLLHGLRKRCHALEDNLSLKDTLATLRRGQGIPVGKKVLIVLDQFEQWLHAKRERENSDLAQALRQCDGGRVQCIVMVRDDFWMAATRFMRELEVRLLEGQNSAAVDLFPIRHAEKVLTAFGRAFGTLPDKLSEVTNEQKSFLTQSVAGLAEEGKVICVRLALFSEMMKGKTWTPATLKEVGGTKGVGVTFLEETFSSSTSPPDHRFHQKTARAVLQDLLPDSGTDIKGYMRSHAELLESSGYGSRPKDFDDLIRILDSEIRLITPTDPEGKDADDNSVIQTQAGQKYFQLTHDYLVHSLRDWLTRKQKETTKGRAELKLFDTSVTWNAKPEHRFLPSWWDNLSIWLFTDKKKWTEPQRKMMGKAGRVHGIRSAIVLAVLVAIIFGGITIRNATLEENNATIASGQVNALLKAEVTQVPNIISGMEDFRPWVDPILRIRMTVMEDGSTENLHLALALLPVDGDQIAYLSEQLMVCSPSQFSVIRQALQPHKDKLKAALWQTAQDKQQSTPRRFQAASALASYAPENEYWENEDFSKFVAEHLVSVRSSELLPWTNALRPVKEHLTTPLAAIYRNDNRDEQVRSFATDTLADYLSDDIDGLFDLLADAAQSQFAPLFDKLAANPERAIELGSAELAKTPAYDASENTKEGLARRQANAAVMLLRMSSTEPVWPLLRHSADPRVRSYFIHWLSPRGGDPNTIIARYEQETDVTVRRALLLCLGGFNDSQLPKNERVPLIETLLGDLRGDPDSGIHGASEWLLRIWGQAEEIAAIERELQHTEQQLNDERDSQRRWYINGQRQTFVILDASEYQMGSPESEAGRYPFEQLHQQQIGRRIAISTKEVTKAQWRTFAMSANVWAADQEQLTPYIQTDDSPMLAMTWYEATQYCNWLSEQEGIPKEQWCYEVNQNEEYGPGMKAKDNFLELTGYRLPTEAEWEFACRAGAGTSRYYGTSETLLPQYAWYQANAENHTSSVASLKPNDFGLFDMHGNALEWCYEASHFTDFVAVAADAPGSEAVSDVVRRVIRGGSFIDPALRVRSANRNNYFPAMRIYAFIGFRPARTYRLFP